MAAEASVRTRPVRGSYGMNTCCPNSNDGTHVASGNITVWVTICGTPPPPDPNKVYVQVVPDPSPGLVGFLVYWFLAFFWAVLGVLRLTSPWTTANSRIDLGNNCWLYQFPPVPGAASAGHPTGSGNTLVVQYTDFSGTTYPPEQVPFTGYNDYGCECGSGPGNQTGSGCGGSGGGSPGMTTLTHPATFKIEMSGLVGLLAVWNGVHLVKCSHPASLNWENGPEGTTQRRIAMKHCARTQTFTLTLQGQDQSFSAKAAAKAPFEPLVFELQDMPHQHGQARIVATGIRG
jgi:hypothetical protein